MASKINGFTVGYTVTGAIVLWSGIKGASVSATVQSAMSGSTNPPQTQPINGPGSTSSTGSASIPPPTATGNTAKHNQAIAKMMAHTYGWSTGNQWNALVALWNQESGWSNTAVNSTSGALGVAQALGHGTANSGGNLGNEYPVQAANNGSAGPQIAWGLQYIQQRYGNPVNAWDHEVNFGWY